MRVKEFAILIPAIGVLLCLFFYDVVFFGKTFKITTANPQALYTGPYGQENNRPSFYPVATSDVSLNEEPTLKFIKDAFRKGILPLWNPHQGCGYPLIGLIQVGLFYPLNFIYYLLPDLWAWDALMLARMFFAGLFMYIFMRRLNVSRFASAGAMMMWMLGRPMVVVQAWMVNVDLLIPLVLFGVEQLIQGRGRLRAVTVLSLAVGLSCFAGHPEHLILVHGLSGLFFIFRLVIVPLKGERLKIILNFLLSYLFGAALAAVVILPFLQNYYTEFWHSHPQDMGMIRELAGGKRQIISLLFPNFYQDFPLSKEFYFSAWWVAVGTLPFGLAFLGLLHRREDRLNLLFFSVAAVILLKIFWDPFFIRWIFGLPFIRLIRIANHAVHLFYFSLCAVAGFGIEAVFTGKRNIRKGMAFAVFCFSILGWALFESRHETFFGDALRQSILSASVITVFILVLVLCKSRRINSRTVQVLLALCICFELFNYVPRSGYVKKFNSFPDVPYVDFLKNSSPRGRAYGMFWTLYPNTAAGYQIDDLGIYHGLLMRRYVEFVNQLLVRNYFKKDFRKTAFWVIPVTFLPDARPFLDLLNVRYTVGPNPIERVTQPLSAMKKRIPEFSKLPSPIYSKEANIYVHLQAMERVFVVHRALVELDEKGVIESLRSNKTRLRSLAVLQGLPDDQVFQRLQNAPAEDASFARIVLYRPNEVIVEAGMQSDGLVVLGDTYHPDWRAFVDGQPAEIFITDYLLRSVFVPQGNHTLRFVFRPDSFYWGRGISLFAFLLWIFLGLTGLKITRRKC